MPEAKIVPVKCNLDLAAEAIDAMTARFIKGLTPYVGATDAYQGIKEGENKEKLKPNQSNALYVNIEIPAGKNYAVGAKGFPETSEVYVLVWNSLNNHFIYRLNCLDRTFNIVKIDPCFNFQKKPKYFMGESQIILTVFKLVNPDTNEEFTVKELKWTDGFNYQGFCRPDDLIATNGFDETLYPYFQGNYDRCFISRLGLPTPKSCIEIQEIAKPLFIEIHTGIVPVIGTAPDILYISTAFGFPPQVGDQITIVGAPLSGTYRVTGTATTLQGYYTIYTHEPVFTTGGAAQVTVTLSRPANNQGTSNNLLFNTWQFRIKDTDVWGRVSEYGLMSNMYVPGINDCLGVSSNLASCLNLIFDAGNPFINTKEIAWRNCNDELWHTETTLFLYTGSNIGQWWLRPRNPDINYDPVTNKITYKFCRDKECDPIDVKETNKVQPGQPKVSQAIAQFPEKDALLNNKDGFNPFSAELRSKTKYTIIPPGAANPDARNITIYVAIGNISGTDGFSFQQVSKGSDKFYYGGMFNGVRDTGLCNAKNQFFKNIGQSGFCGKMVNGPSVISTQVYIDGTGNVVDDPALDGYNLSPTHRTLQKFEFTNMPKGSYIFYITAASSDPSIDTSYIETSTPVWGVCPFNKPNNYLLSYNDRTTFPTSELYIDCCAGDYNTLNDNKMLTIVNLAVGGVFAQSGYFYENSVNKIRWELLKILPGGSSSGISSLRTDRNGFYWVAGFGSGIQPPSDFYIDVFAYSKCRRIFTGTKIDFQLRGIGIITKDYFMDTYFDTANQFEPAVCNVVEIKGRLLLQGTAIGVGNVVVALTRGGFAISDEEGFFTLLAHDDATNSNPVGQRKDILIVTAGACTYLENGGCIHVVNILFNNCVTCLERIVDVGVTLLTYKTERGLLSGGVYLARETGYDWLGRKTYSQPTQQLNIPTIIQSQAIGPCIIQVDIDPTAIYPPEISYLTFSLSAETTIDKYLSWIVDRVEFIDNTNAVNNIAPTQIKIYYKSIIEFSAINNFNTTTAWQFIPTGQNTPATGDRVRFWLNGDSKFFTKNISGLVKYDQSGEFF